MATKKGNTKAVSYRGIPKQYRRQIADTRKALARIGAAAVKSPAELYVQLADREATEERKKQEDAARRAEYTRKGAIRTLGALIEQLYTCRTLALAIEEEADDSYISREEMGAFVRMGLDEAGKDLEQALCDLGIVPEKDHGLFLDAERKSRGVKFEPEEEATEEQEATNV